MKLAVLLNKFIIKVVIIVWIRYCRHRRHWYTPSVIPSVMNVTPPPKKIQKQSKKHAVTIRMRPFPVLGVEPPWKRLLLPGLVYILTFTEAQITKYDVWNKTHVVSETHHFCKSCSAFHCRRKKIGKKNQVVQFLCNICYYLGVKRFDDPCSSCSH